MAREQDLSRSSLRQEIETCHQEVLARCFTAAEGQGGDDALARKYAHLLRELANLPRDRVMALRFLPELLPVPAPKDEARSASSSDEFVLFRRVAEAAGYGFVVTDLKGRIIYVNPALCRMLGLNDGETGIGRSIYDFYPQPDRDDVMRRIIPAVMKAGQWTGELPLCCVRGRMTPTIQNLFIVHAGRGVAPALANLIIDITERKNAEEALRQSEERFRAVFENSAVGIYCTAPDGRILMANPALVRMLGYSSFEELAGRNLETEGYEPQYPRAAFKLELEREGGISGREAAWLRRDGTILYVRESARCIRDARGETLYYEGIAEDISARRAAEEALRTSEENFRALAENAHDGILIATGEGQHVFANPRAAEITGYTQSELLTMGFRQLAAPEEVQRLDENYRRRLAGKEVSA
ncbi:MAG: PAS domain S-box protein, partial [Candidatus Eisenbacteria bacterium]